MAMVWARMIFLHVIGKNAPAFTVASLAMIMHIRPCTRPTPVTTPAAGGPAVLGVHGVRGPQAVFLERRAGVDEFLDAFARSEAPLLVLAVDSRLAAAELDLGLGAEELGGEVLEGLGGRRRLRRDGWRGRGGGHVSPRGRGEGSAARR